MEWRTNKWGAEDKPDNNHNKNFTIACGTICMSLKEWGVLKIKDNP